MVKENSRYLYVKKELFEAWLQRHKAEVWLTPDYRRADVYVSGKFENGVKWEFRTVAVNTKTGRYGRYGAWDAIRLPRSPYEAISLIGKGSRDVARTVLGKFLADMDPGLDFEGLDLVRIGEDPKARETVVRLVDVFSAYRK